MRQAKVGYSLLFSTIRKKDFDVLGELPVKRAVSADEISTLERM
jgi:hypothetical protein